MADQSSFGSVNLIRQGEHRFFTFSMPGDVLARCCYVVSREEDPNEGLQRELDINRAKEIAKYIDTGLGTIPSSIILSAQEECRFTYDSKTKSVSFENIPTAFLIIDGQHRVYGFKFAEKAFRVPVVVYSGLSKSHDFSLISTLNSVECRQNSY
jgi:DGQHR domain-containing protein